MRTGVSYLGHHNPRHMLTDIKEMQTLGCADVLLAAQENDFVWLDGKLKFLPRIAADHGIRPIAIFWGLFNLFGGGRSSQFLLDHPDCHQSGKAGEYRSVGCYMNPKAVAHVKELIDRIAQWGYKGYFIDEPTPIDCYCAACCNQYREWSGGDLKTAKTEDVTAFRSRCVTHYIETIAGYIKSTHPHIETMCCLMECDQSIWEAAAKIANLDNLGSDIYWCNNTRPVEEMTPLVRNMADICRKRNKIHHEWLQCWTVKAGNEQRIIDQGRILIRERPDALYIWAYAAQVGTQETCANVELAWSNACQILREAKS
ncbi:MAG TPA: hypothetical protein VEJ63_10090 [Planctomycetota bacterium]|nr:hypothetical protein [Planctomycetota bacterium]